jgi:hypothetical protein
MKESISNEYLLNFGYSFAISDANTKLLSMLLHRKRDKVLSINLSITLWPIFYSPLHAIFRG